MTIYERVLAHLKEQPGTPKEIAEALNLKKRDEWGRYYWGKWRFGDAEMRGLIEWKDERWHLKEAEREMGKPFTDLGFRGTKWYLAEEVDRILEAVREFVLSRRSDIEKDVEDFGMLAPVLEYFLSEAEA